jgi:hypothetical protein
VLDRCDRVTGVDPGYFERRYELVVGRDTLVPSLGGTADGEGQTTKGEQIWFHGASIPAGSRNIK